jgi:hypothetical protein
VAYKFRVFADSRDPASCWHVVGSDGKGAISIRMESREEPNATEVGPHVCEHDPIPVNPWTLIVTSRSSKIHPLVTRCP